jgi:hypothetical protein
MPMLVRNRLVTLVRIEQTGWARVPNMESPTETNVVTAHLSDGTTRAIDATIVYAAGERERIFEAMLEPNADPEPAIQAVRSIARRRAAAVKEAYRVLQVAHGKPAIA